MDEDHNDSNGDVYSGENGIDVDDDDDEMDSNSNGIKITVVLRQHNRRITNLPALHAALLHINNAAPTTLGDLDAKYTTSPPSTTNVEKQIALSSLLTNSSVLTAANQRNQTEGIEGTESAILDLDWLHNHGFVTMETLTLHQQV